MSFADRIIPPSALRWGRLTKVWPWSDANPAIDDRIDMGAVWDDLARRLEGPTRHCPVCGTWLAGDDLFDSPECQWRWMEDA